MLPKVSVEIEGSRTNDDWNPLDPEANNDWTVQGVLTWTFDMFRRRDTVKRDRVSHAQKSVMRRHLVQRIMQEVMQAYAAVKQYERDIRFARQAKRSSELNFEANKELYNGQMATYPEIVTAQTQMTEARRAYYRTLVQHRISKAVLERKMGVLR
ncbi:TolC family protein [Thermodesulfobacteriota bacterium]